MKKFKRIFSIILSILVISTFSFSAFAKSAGEPWNTSYVVKITPSVTSVNKGGTVTIRLNAEIEAEESIEIKKSKIGAYWCFRLDYDNTAFSYESIAVNYSLTQTGLSKDLGTAFNFEAEMSTDTVSILKDTPIASITFKAKEDLETLGAKTFSLSSISILDDDYNGIDGAAGGSVTVPITTTVTVTDSEPVVTYPNLAEETFDTESEVNDIAVDSDSKVWTVFQKNTTGATLVANTYGIQVVTGDKTYKFAGIVDVPAEDASAGNTGIWAIKLVAPEQKFAGGEAFAPTSIKAYWGESGLSGELID